MTLFRKLGNRLQSGSPLARWLEKLAGVALIAFGVRLFGER
jgi:threonine/homoserine/homoserine lactone efflux protein